MVTRECGPLHHAGVRSCAITTLREMAPEIPLVLEAPRRGALRPYEELLHRGFDLGCRAGRDAYPVTIVSVERRDDWPATASSPHTARRAGRHRYDTRGCSEGSKTLPRPFYEC